MNAQNVTEMRSSVEGVVDDLLANDHILLVASQKAAAVSRSLERLFLHRQYKGEYRTQCELGYLKHDLAELDEMVAEWLSKNEGVNDETD